jgi:hypothetical protein
MDVDKDLLDKPEVSLAVALGDHNFSDLREFAIGHKMDSGGTTASHSVPQPLQPPSVQTASATAKADETLTLSSQSVLSLSYILNPTPENICQPHTPKLSPPATKDVDDLVPASEVSMEIDVSLPSSTFTKDPSVNSSQIGTCSSQKMEKKGGLLGWLKVGASKKRTCKDAEISSIDSDESDSASTKGSKGRRKSLTKKIKSSAGAISGPGLSRAATASRELRRKVLSGEFKPDPRRLENWTKEIKKIDPDAEVNDKTAKDVRHSTCGRWYKVKEPYDTYRFRKHVNGECFLLPRSAAAGVPTISQWQQKFNIDVHNPNNPNPLQRQIPCPGITEHDDHRVTTYLERTGATGGGARSITVLAKERFNKLFSRLSRKHKREVLDAQIHEHKWHNDHQNSRVFSDNCLKDVIGPGNDRVLPCSNCAHLLRNHNFKQALNKPKPKDEHFPYINKRWRPAGTLIQLFGRVTGLREIVEDSVCCLY